MAFQHDRATILNYSDDPEHVKLPAGAGGGILFRFDAAAPTRQRLLYYHQNNDVHSRVCAIRAVAKTPGTSLAVIRTVNFGPSDFLAVGHVANAAFLRALDAQTALKTINLAHAGDSADVQPGVIVGPGAVVNGLVEVAPVSGTAEILVLWAESAAALGRAQSGAHTFPDDTPPPGLPDFKLRIGKFDLTQLGALPLAHSVGGAAGDATIGDRVLTNTGKTQAGNDAPDLTDTFGVFSRVAVEIDNTNATSERVALYQSSHGGAATATYWIDGRVIESATLNPSPKRDKVHVYPVPGNGKVHDEILVSIDPGGSGPIHLILDADDGTPAPGTAKSVVFVPGDGRTFRSARPA
jgi:hypothetical protein